MIGFSYPRADLVLAPLDVEVEQEIDIILEDVVSAIMTF